MCFSFERRAPGAEGGGGGRGGRVEFFDDARLQVLDARLQQLGARRDAVLKSADELALPLVRDLDAARRHQPGGRPEQAHERGVRLLALGGQLFLYTDDRAPVVFGRQPVLRADEVDGEHRAREVCAHGLLGLRRLFERELLLGQHAVAALPQLVAHALALRREVCRRLREVDELRRRRSPQVGGGRGGGRRCGDDVRGGRRRAGRRSGGDRCRRDRRCGGARSAAPLSVRGCVSGSCFSFTSMFAMSHASRRS